MHSTNRASASRIFMWHRCVRRPVGKGNHSVRSDRWRDIRYADGSDEFYDHSNDPWEWTNLATLPEHAEVIDKHKKWLPKNER